MQNNLETKQKSNKITKPNKKTQLKSNKKPNSWVFEKTQLKSNKMKTQHPTRVVLLGCRPQVCGSPLLDEF